MIFSITSEDNKALGEFFKNSVVYLKKYFRLKQYFGINWEFNLPVLFVVKDLAIKKHAFGTSAPKWLKGWCGRQNEIFVLSPQLILQEEGIKFTPKKHRALIKHELIHLFYSCITKNIKPRWLNEGLCQYLSGQLEWKKEHKTFSLFLSFFEETGAEIYIESGWAVKYLVDKFGKDKLLKLFKEIRGKSFNRKEFAKIFESVYEAKLNYKFFNQI